MKRILNTPTLGILCFLTFYVYACSQYQGGTQFNPNQGGYSWSQNYWCDLLAEPTYAGQDNPSKPIALIGMVILAASLIFFWIKTARTMRPVQKFLVGSGGSLAMICSLLVVTRLHDAVIYLCGILGFAAFATVAIHSRHKPPLTIMAFATAFFVLLDFSLWHFHYRMDLCPVIQKLAFISFFGWVIVVSSRQMMEGSPANMVRGPN